MKTLDPKDHSFMNWLNFQIQNFYLEGFIVVLAMVIYSFFIANGIGLIICNVFLVGALVGIIYKGFIQAWNLFINGKSE